MTAVNQAGMLVVAHTYDWVNWVSGAVPSTVYALPAGCVQAPPASRLPLPTNNSLASNPPPPAKMPQLPMQFTVVLEGKTDTVTVRAGICLAPCVCDRADFCFLCLVVIRLTPQTATTWSSQ